MKMLDILFGVICVVDRRVACGCPRASREASDAMYASDDLRSHVHTGGSEGDCASLRSDSAPQASCCCTMCELSCAGCIVLCFQDCERYKLGDARSFHYLNQSDCFELNGVSNGREYVKTRRAMDVVGISPEEQVRCFS
jgi:hypothetical protein